MAVPATWSSAELASVLEHTLLAADATSAAIERLCDEALAHRFAAVCVNGTHVSRCARRLAGTGVGLCAVVGFPLGAAAARVKEFEAGVALEDGAGELDMVMNLGALKADDHSLVTREIELVVRAAHAAGARIKVILETGLLTPEELVSACRLSEAAGADYVKTSTGFGPRGASIDDVTRMRGALSPRIGIKAAGGVRTRAFALELLAAGATRLGSSACVALIGAP